MAVAPQGHWHCRQANHVDSKPQQSWPTRVLDIGGKLILQTASPAVSANEGARYHGQATVWPQAPAVSTNGGARHHGQATSMVAVMQKGINGMAARPCQNSLSRRIFCWESEAACGGTLNTMVDMTSHFFMQTSNAQEEKFGCVHGAPLKRRVEQAGKFFV